MSYVWCFVDDVLLLKSFRFKCGNMLGFVIWLVYKVECFYNVKVEYVK